jgi:hypothetical protein
MTPHRSYPRRGLLTVALPLLLAAIGCGRDEPSPSAGRQACEPWFVEVGRDQGLDFVHRSGHRERFLFPEITGGGAALFDMDGDGDLDAYLVQSGDLTEPGGAAGTNRLFRNGGRGDFADVTSGSGAGDRGYGMGVAAADYDNDGDVDLYVTNFGRNVLLDNAGGGRFTDATERAGVGDPSFSASAAFLDYDLDGDLDLFVVNYVDWSLDVELDCHDPQWLPDYCLPTNYAKPAMDRLYRNEGDGRFTDVTVRAGLGAAFGNGLGVVCGDFDGDGSIDVFVSNDATMNQLWLNDGEGGFRDEALLRGCAIDEQGMVKAGMGVAAEDFDDDADLDLLIVNLQNQTDSFFRNDGGFFVDATGAAGLTTTTRWFTRFGVGTADFDNDGFLDLYLANGRVMKSPEPPTDDVYAEPNLLLRGDGSGAFTEVSPRGGTATELIATSRAAAFGDVDNDGGVDVLVVNRDGPAYLLRNVHPSRGHWIRFSVLDGNGRDGLGATLSLTVGGRRITRGVRSAYSFLASNDPRVHVGLGDRVRVEEVSVRWIDGEVESFGGFGADRQVTLRRSAGLGVRRP